MRQQFADLTGALRGQATQHITQVRVGVMPIEPGRLDQTHYCSATLARPERARKQPVVSADGNWADLVLDPVVVHRQTPVIHETSQCNPTFQAVVQCLGRG